MVQPQAVLQAVHPGLDRPAAYDLMHRVDRHPPPALCARRTAAASTPTGNRGSATVSSSTIQSPRSFTQPSSAAASPGAASGSSASAT